MAFAERAPKRAKLLDDDSDASDAEATLETSQTNGFAINKEYAQRFEHNAKRTELHRLEEKYGKDAGRSILKRARDQYDEDDDDEEEEEEDSSDDESEDDDAEFATQDVDAEILDTLNAIRSKDPRLYNKDVKFYKEFVAPEEDGEAQAKKEKPVYLQDYHRKNLLAGEAQDEADEAPRVQTYQDEQDQMRRDLVGSMHAKAAGADNEEDVSDTGDFLVAKTKPKHESLPSVTREAPQITERDVTAADKDPETYLSNFMAARAWLPQKGSQWDAFDSDDSEEEDRADEFEEAYNMRFEDPAKSNEKLQSFARDVAKYSVRRDEKSGRRRAREREQDKKDYERRERDEERARLRKLKLEEAEEKLKKIKEAAGISGKSVRLEDWRDVIEGDFDDDVWEVDMKRRFGDQYYADEDAGEVPSGDEAVGGQKKIRKPKWDDDIDIGDIVPGFDEETEKAQFTLSDDEADGGVQVREESDEELGSERKKSKTKKGRAKEKGEAKRAARLERRKLEEMVDAAMPLAHPALAGPAGSKAPVTGFRYRDTSPTSFGLSSRDILFASDAQLNEFAGLKKLAAYRDADKKQRDKKKLSKKARLRQWRKDTFGNAEAPTGGFEKLLGRHGGTSEPSGADKDGVGSGVVEGERKKKKRSRKAKKEPVKAT